VEELFWKRLWTCVGQNTELWMITSPKAIPFSVMNFEGPEHGQNCTCCVDPWCRVWINQRMEDINAYFYGMLIVEDIQMILYQHWCGVAKVVKPGQGAWTDVFGSDMLKYRVTIKEILDTFNIIKTVSVADTQFA
jgi:hypothetical protein